MKFFADTADIKELKEVQEMGLLDGVTTNPSLIAKSGKDFKSTIAEICRFCEGPVSAEVAALDYDGMMREGNILRTIAKNVTVKVPLTVDGLRACKSLSSDGTWSMSPCVFQSIKPCSPLKRAPHLFHLLSAVLTTSISTEWS